MIFNCVLAVTAFLCNSSHNVIEQQCVGTRVRPFIREYILGEKLTIPCGPLTDKRINAVIMYKLTSKLNETHELPYTGTTGTLYWKDQIHIYASSFNSVLVNNITTIKDRTYWSHDSVKNRAKVDLGDNISFKIRNAEWADEGYHHCWLKYRKNLPKSIWTRISIVEFPSKMNFFIKSKFGLYTEENPLRAAFTVVCEVYGGTPSPNVTLSRNGKKITTNITHTHVENKIIIEYAVDKVTEDWRAATLACTACNSLTHDPLVKTIPKLQIIRVPEWTVIDKKVVLRPGEMSNITCTSKGSESGSNITWHRNNDSSDFLAKHDSTYNDIMTSMLTIQPNINDDGALLTCLVSFGKYQLDFDSMQMSIEHATECAGGRAIFVGVQINEKVELTCPLTVDPLIKRIKWTLKKKEINLDASRNKKLSVLYRIRSESQYNDAIYCTGTNDIGNKLRTCKLIMIPAESPDPPRDCRLNWMSSHNLIVQCHIDESIGLDQHFLLNIYGSKNSTLTNSKIYGLQSGRVVTFAANSSLLSKINQGDTLGVVAVNRIGSSPVLIITDFNYADIPRMSPDPPRDCWSNWTSSNSLIVQCQIGESFGLDQHFLLNIYGSKNFTLTNSKIYGLHSGRVVTFTADSSVLSKINEGDTLAVVAMNGKGSSPAVILTDFNYADIPRSHWITTITVILAIMLFAIILPTVVLYQYKQRVVPVARGDNIELRATGVLNCIGADNVTAI